MKNMYAKAIKACHKIQSSKNACSIALGKAELYSTAINESIVLNNPLISLIVFNTPEVMRLSKYQDHKSFADAIVKDEKKLKQKQHLFLQMAEALKSAADSDAEVVKAAEELIEDFFIISDSKYPKNKIPKDVNEKIIDGEIKSISINEPSCPFVNKGKYQSAAEYIYLNWKNLVKETPQTTSSSLIPLPYPFVVPGGRFREIYYWDSYFTIVGLLESKLYDLARGMVDNFLYLVEQIGFIPNGNRLYYLSRSQPPFLAMMVDLLIPYTDKDWLKRAYELVKKEYVFEWQNKDTHLIPSVGLNRYYDGINAKRPECFGTDEVRKDVPDYYQHERAACESGLDFTNRFSNGVIQMAAVDLNALLYKYETLLQKWADCLGLAVESAQWATAAHIRKQRMNKYLYHAETGLFYDYNVSTCSCSSFQTIANAYVLWAEIASPEQALCIRNFIFSELKTKGGVLNMKRPLRHDGVLGQKLDEEYQWDEPNGWAPLQFIVAEGLRQYGFEADARQIAGDWLDLNTKVFADQNKFFEKYNVVSLADNVKTNYPQQDGFGWTNGVFLHFLNNFV